MIFFLMVLSFNVPVLYALKGDHICPQEERVKVYVTKTVLKTVKVRHYNWCANVPPRCSYYTDEERWVPETVEEEHVSKVDKCCTGYRPDENQKFCIPHCDKTTCFNGQCNYNNTCNCHAGFHGESCEEECPDGVWGENCLRKCNCEKCSPITGNCICSKEIPWWRCKQTTEKPTSPYISSFLHPFLQNHTKRPFLQKYHTFLIPEETTMSYVTNSNEVTSSGVLNPPITTTEEAMTTYDDKDGLQYTPINPDTIQDRNTLLTLIFNTSQNATNTSLVDTIDKLTTPSMMTSSGLLDVATYNDNNSPIVKKAIALTTESIKDTELLTKQNGNDLVSESYRNSEPYFVGLHFSPFKRADFIFAVGALIGVIVTIIVISGIFLTTKRSKRKITTVSTAIIREQRDNSNDRQNRSMSINSRKSVIHSPLPDPPTVSNSMYSPGDAELSNDINSNFDTRIICSMSFTAPCGYIRESQMVDQFYDHPPSTGSYRAASLPEPPEENLERTAITLTTFKEPVYDEIPCWKHPIPVTTINKVNFS